MAVIAISQQLGSRGIALGELTATQLGYRFQTGQQLIAETATRFNVSAEQMAWFDVRNPHFWERQKAETQRFAAYYRAVLLSHAAQDRFVIAGWGSAHLIPEECAIRVRVIAPLGERVKQVAEEEKLAHGAAEKRVRDFDLEAKSRTHSLSGVDLDDASLYDIIINTARRSLPIHAATLAAFAKRVDSDTDAARAGIIRDAAIGAQVHAALIAHPKIRDAQVAVRCASGAVLISGPGLVPPWDELIIGVARQIDGVASVEVGSEDAPITLPN